MRIHSNLQKRKTQLHKAGSIRILGEILNQHLANLILNVMIYDWNHLE